jgi:hypothetical protein
LIHAQGHASIATELCFVKTIGRVTRE